MTMDIKICDRCGRRIAPNVGALGGWFSATTYRASWECSLCEGCAEAIGREIEEHPLKFETETVEVGR